MMKPYNTAETVYTPSQLALAVGAHFPIRGRVLEPCRGAGAFWDALAPFEREWCELDGGRDFYDFTTPVDWIVTNPPWSAIGRFLEYGFTLAPEIVLLIPIQLAFASRKRVRIVQEAGFGLREIFCVPYPKEWKSFGYQLGACWWQKGWGGGITLGGAVGR